MNREIKSEWLSALRSGEFKQGQGHLKSYDPSIATFKYCCLGVLCELHSRKFLETWDDDNPVNCAYMGNSSILPHIVQRWARLDDDPRILYDDVKGEYHQLSTINDNGANFNKIADLIEAQL